MVGNVKPLGLRYRMLALLNLGIKKLFHATTVQADQVVMVLTFVEFVDRFAAFEMTAHQNVSLLKLGQYPVHGGQSHVRMLQQQHAKHVLGSHVALLTFLKNLQNFQTGKRGLESRAFEFVDLGHGCLRVIGLVVPVQILLEAASTMVCSYCHLLCPCLILSLVASG